MTSSTGPAAGELLVASAAHGAGYFKQTVIYLLDADESGALGVVLNRHSPADLDEVLPQWSDLVSPPQQLFAGGPVSPNGAVCVAMLADPAEDPPGWRRVHGELGLLHLDTPIEIARGAYAEQRIFAGYAGWEAGQLEGELLQGYWHRFSATEADVFGADQEDLWRRVMRRQGGQTAWFATWTEDAELN